MHLRKSVGSRQRGQVIFCITQPVKHPPQNMWPHGAVIASGKYRSQQIAQLNGRNSKCFCRSSSRIISCESSSFCRRGDGGCSGCGTLKSSMISPPSVSTSKISNSLLVSVSKGSFSNGGGDDDDDSDIGGESTGGDCEGCSILPYNCSYSGVDVEPLERCDCDDNGTGTAAG